jgi:hypothetical protein
MLTAVMNQFKLTAEDTSRIVDVLVNASAAGRGTASEFAEGLKYVGTMANMMGLSLEETTAALVALNNAGLDATTAGRYLAGMLSDLIAKGKGIIPTWDNFNNLIRQGKISMEDAIAVFDKVVPSLGLSKLASEDLELAWHELTNAVEEGIITQDQIAQALKKAGFEVNRLGFEIYNADGSMKSLNEIITLLTNRLNSFATQAERDAYINEMFGEQSRRAAVILAQQSDQLANLTDKLGETGSAGEMVNEIMDTTAGRLAKVNAESQNASLGFGGLTAQLKEAFAGFTTLLGPLASTAQALGPSLLQGAVAGLTAALPTLIANVGGVHAAFGAFSTFLSGSIIPLLTNPLTLAIMGVIATVGLLYMAWQNNWGGIRDITDRVVKYLKDVLGGFSDWVKGVVDMFGRWIKSIQDWWSGLVQSISGTKVEAPTFKPPRGYMRGVEVPTMQKGGLVPETGLYLLHAGEYVVPSSEPAVNITVNVNITPSHGMDERTLAQEAAKEVERRLRSVLIEKTSSQAKTSRIRV